MQTSLLLVVLFCTCVLVRAERSTKPQSKSAFTRDGPTFMERSTFTQEQDEVEWVTLRKYLTYAYASFCLEDLQNWTCYWCTNMTGVPPLKVTKVVESDGVYGTYGYVGYSTTEIIVAFRGSSSVENWIKDAEFVQISYPGVDGADVHYGFYESYAAVAATVLSQVQTIQKTYNIPVVLTGHSLGAAVAVLGAVDLFRNGIQNVQVYTFGQPRVGNKVFSEYFRKIIPISRRTVNQQDIVPHLPPEILNYYHTPTEIWFKDSYTNFTICNGSGEDSHCSDSIPPYDFSNYDHLHYLGYSVGAGSSHGCHGVEPW